MYGNELTALYAGMFQGLRDLKLLSLSGNRLSLIDDNSFTDINSIHELNLGANNLTHLSGETFSHLPRPIKLNLGGENYYSQRKNPLHCDSDLCWLRLEELQGSITWSSYNLTWQSFDWDYISPPPTCANEINWRTWSCMKTGNNSI